MLIDPRGTVESTTYPLKYKNGYNLYLTDTPGFDDTTRSDSIVLKEIAATLGSLHRYGIRLLGIIYFSRITDVRMSGLAIRSLRLFEKLCGEECFRIVVLASTMWDQIDTDTGKAKEKELVENDDFWGKLERGGAQLRRLNGDANSARKVLLDIVENDQSAVMNIQREIIDEGLDLDQTEAGDFILNTFLKKRSQYRKELSEVERSVEEAHQTSDSAFIAVLQEQKKNLEGLLQTANMAQSILNIGYEALASERADICNSQPWDITGCRPKITETLNTELKDKLRLVEAELSRGTVQSYRDRKAAEADKRRLEEKIEKQNVLMKSQEAELQKQ